MKIDPKPLPSQAHLASCLRYSEVTGDLVWNVRPASHFLGARDSERRRWNSRYANRPALSCVNSNGYRTGLLGSEPYCAHRVIWKLVYGNDPDNIDHLNGVTSDNRLCNLRSVTVSINGRNRALRQDSVSGIAGVTCDRRTGKWRARIGIEGQMHSLGTFLTPDMAAEARRKFEIETDFISRPRQEKLS